MSDYYAALGVPRDASPEAIKKAFRRRARELHPDANPGDAAAEAEFKQVAQAYEVLSDPNRRQQYDRFGERGAAGGPMGGTGGAEGGLGDLFSALFGDGFGAAGGRTTGPTGPAGGPDIEATMTIDLDQAVFGSEAPVTARTAVVCDDCRASGSADGSTPVTCVECAGMGQVRRVRQSLLGQMVSAAPCQRCRGMGSVVADPCASCAGDGRVVTEASFTVDVPAGIDDGQTLRLTGRGAVGLRGGPAGDLFIHVRVRPHERFERHGNDLVCPLHVGFAQASLGAEIDLDTFDDTLTVEVAPGTQSGTVVRHRSKGVPRLDGRGRGDLLVQLVVDVPTDLDEAQEELLREYADARGEAVAPPEAGILSKLRSAFR